MSWFNRNWQGILLLVIVAGCIWAVLRMLNAPVVYVDVNGEVCQCMAPMCDQPSKGCCKFVDMNKVHEEVQVGTCERSK